MRSVKVKRDYEIEIDLTIDCEQFWEVAHPGSELSETNRYTVSAKP